MYLLSALTLACLSGVVLGSDSYDFEATLQAAQQCARQVSPYIDDVSAALAPFLEAAEALYDATAVLEQLGETIACLDGLRNEVRDVDTDDTEARRNTSGGILDLRGAASSVFRQFDHLLTRTNRTITYSRELEAVIQAEQEILGSAGSIRCRSDQVGDNYYNTVTGCYYLETTPMTWEAARQACRDRGMDLVSITSREEQDVLDALYETRRSDFHYHWTSGRLTSTPENSRLWVWTALNDQPIDFEDWNPSQPNYLSGDDTIIGSCRSVGGQQRTWCDYESYNSEPALCEQY